MHKLPQIQLVKLLSLLVITYLSYQMSNPHHHTFKSLDSIQEYDHESDTSNIPTPPGMNIEIFIYHSLIML